jgi:hypothetical protein
LEKKLCEEGIVIDGKICPNGKIQRPVLVIKHGTLGLLVLTIFGSKADDPACDYFGRKRGISSGGDYSDASFSLHAITTVPGLIVDGTPSKKLPLSVIIKGGVGSLVMSSRSYPYTSTPGSLYLPERLCGPKTFHKVEGFEDQVFESIQMYFRKDFEGGKIPMWDYDWATAQDGLGLSAEQIEEGMRANSASAIAEIEEQWRDRVSAHKAVLLEKYPMYSDAADDPGTQDTCSTPEGDGPRGRCTLVGDCCCPSDSVNRARGVDVQDFFSCVQSSIRPTKSHVWKEPSMICADELKKISFVATDDQLQTRFVIALSEQGFAIVNELQEKFPSEFLKAIEHAPATAALHCKHPVFIYPAKYGNALDAGRKRKLLGYIGGFENTLEVFMRLCMEHVAPGYRIATGQDVKGNVVQQCELIREIPPPENEQGEVQCVHVDAAVRDPQQDKDCMAILRTNFQYILDSKGPLSLFFPFEREYRLVVFPTAHKPAIECLKNFARHYEAARAAFFKAHKPKPPVSEWKAAWCGCNVRLLHKLFPGQNFDPVCVSVDVGGMLAVSGFLPHCGLPVDGIRGFIAATYEVPLS